MMTSNARQVGGEPSPGHDGREDHPAPRGFRGIIERMAAALGNGEDLVDDRRGWLAEKRRGPSNG
jgi:hypothetical protein